MNRADGAGAEWAMDLREYEVVSSYTGGFARVRHVTREEKRGERLMDGNLGMTQDRAVANRRAMDRLGLDRDSAKEVEGGSVGEALTGAAALVLGILGVIGISPPVLASIGAMCAGVALLLGGGSIAAEAREAFRSRGQSPMRNSVLAGVGLESMAGIAGASLGLLALLGVSRITLLAVAVLVFGTALLMASGAT